MGRKVADQGVERPSPKAYKGPIPRGTQRPVSPKVYDGSNSSPRPKGTPRMSPRGGPMYGRGSPRSYGQQQQAGMPTT